MMRLIIGGKWSSTWTMRGWLACKLSGLPFEAETLLLSRDDSKAKLAAVSPTGLIPILFDGDLAITDTWAIAEYLWEKTGGCDIWPEALRCPSAPPRGPRPGRCTRISWNCARPCR